MDLSAMVPLAIAACALAPTARAIGRWFAEKVTTRVVEHYAVAMGRMTLLVGALLVFGASAIWSASGTASAVATTTVGVLCVGLLLALERRWPRQSGSVRRTAVEPRTLSRYVRGRLTVLAVVAVLSAVLALSLTLAVRWPAATAAPGPSIVVAVLGTPEDDGTVKAVAVQAVHSAAGWWWALLAVTVTTLCAGFAVRYIIRRPPLADVADQVDAAVRRISAERLVRLVITFWSVLALLLLSDLSDALHLLGLSARGLPVGLANFVGWCQWLPGLLILVCFLIGPIRLPRSVMRIVA